MTSGVVVRKDDVRLLGWLGGLNGYEVVGVWLIPIRGESPCKMEYFGVQVTPEFHI